MVLACPPHQTAAFQRYERATFLAPRKGNGIGTRTGGTKFEPGLPNRLSPVGATHKSTVPRTTTTSARSLSAVAIYKLHAGPLNIIVGSHVRKERLITCTRAVAHHLGSHVIKER
jgi:hypothetical protein